MNRRPIPDVLTLLSANAPMHELLEGRHPPVDAFKDKQTGQVVEFCWEANLISWSRLPAYPGEVVYGEDWVPLPANWHTMPYPWRTADSAKVGSGRKR